MEEYLKKKVLFFVRRLKRIPYFNENVKMLKSFQIGEKTYLLAELDL